MTRGAHSEVTIIYPTMAWNSPIIFYVLTLLVNPMLTPFVDAKSLFVSTNSINFPMFLVGSITNAKALVKMSSFWEAIGMLCSPGARCFGGWVDFMGNPMKIGLFHGKSQSVNG